MSETPGSLREKYMGYIRRLRLIDDDFAKKVFDDIPCTELILRIILDKPDLKVGSVKSEYEIHNLWGRSVRFDVFATDSVGRRYDIEIQRADTGAGAMRARYNSSLMDAEALKRGGEIELPETYVIFITENDVLSKGLPIYHIERIITETGDKFEDKAHIIYVNSKIIDDTPLGKLMHDFVCTKAEEMNYEILSDKVKYFKTTEEGVGSMCKIMEDIRREGREEGRIKGREEGREEGKIKGREEGRNGLIAELKKMGVDESVLRRAAEKVS